MGRFVDRKLFFLIAFGFTLGVFVRSLVSVSALLFLLVALSLLFTGWHASSRRVLVVSLCAAGVAAGIFRFDVSSRSTIDPRLDALVGERVELSGVIDDEPDRRETKTFITVAVDASLADGASSPVSARVIMSVAPYERFTYGERVRAKGTLIRPEKFESHSGGTFDYPAYLEGKGIRYELKYPTLRVVSEGEGNPAIAALFKVKHAFLGRIALLVHEPESSLLGGLLAGEKQSLGKEWLDKFRAAGVVHLVVLSGYNITIVADAILAFASFAAPAVSFAAAAAGIVVFATMVGGGATVVRASIMALLVILARRLGRTYDASIALIVAGFAMILWNPHILVFDPSFQLSFLATVGIMYAAPWFEHRLSFLPKTLGIREITAATLGTQFLVLPLLLYQTGTVSIAALPANLLILLSVPAAMLFGFLAGTIGFASLALATPFALVANAILSYQLFVVDILSRVPYASLAVGVLPGVLVLALYSLYALFVLPRAFTKAI